MPAKLTEKRPELRRRRDARGAVRTGVEMAGLVEDFGTFQDPPRICDEWRDDVALRRALERLLPDEVLASVTPRLAALGVEAATTLRELADGLDDPRTEPRLVAFDA